MNGHAAVHAPETSSSRNSMASRAAASDSRRRVGHQGGWLRMTVLRFRAYGPRSESAVAPMGSCHPSCSRRTSRWPPGVRCCMMGISRRRSWTGCWNGVHTSSCEAALPYPQHQTTGGNRSGCRRCVVGLHAPAATTFERNGDRIRRTHTTSAQLNASGYRVPIKDTLSACTSKA
jgi:hypothetical protein